MESIKDFIKGKLSKKSNINVNDIVSVLNELDQKNNKYLKPYISTLLDTLNNESTKIYGISDKVSKQPSLTNKGGDDFWNKIGEYVKLNDITINIINTKKSVLCCLDNDICILDSNNNIKRYTDIFKDSYFEDNISRDRENEDPTDPENSGEGHAAVSSRFGDNNWPLDFWTVLGRESNSVGEIISKVFDQFDYSFIKSANGKLIENVLTDKNTYIILTENK